MLYPHFPENYLSFLKFAIFLPTNFSEEPYFLIYMSGVYLGLQPRKINVMQQK
jgi:hypothetical protein